MRHVEQFSYEVKKTRLVYSGLLPSEVSDLLSCSFINDEVFDGDDYHGPFIPKIVSDATVNEYGGIEDAPYTWTIEFTNKSCQFFNDDPEEELTWLRKEIEKELGWK